MGIAVGVDGKDARIEMGINWAVVIGPRKSIYFYFFWLHFGEYVVVRPT